MYTDDTLGLRELYESGRLLFYSKSCKHVCFRPSFIRDTLLPLIDETMDLIPSEY